MKTISESLLSAGHSIEYLHCPSNNDWIEGFIVSDARIGIIDDAVPEIRKHISDENLQVIVLENEMKIHSANRDAIGQLNADISSKFQEAYGTFAASLKAHDEIEDIYIANMDFTKANQLSNDLIELFFGEEKADKPSNVKHRFLGAATPDGAVDFIQNLTEDIGKRYFIKGRAGSGKSTMLKKIAAAGEKRDTTLKFIIADLIQTAWTWSFFVKKASQYLTARHLMNMNLNEKQMRSLICIKLA
ncbi:hypothetical protein MGI18_14805 [Bacillus sp. OVS6]|nr:hypothetical protein MGI18_14805 [Bacillus sp. OVS6]